MLEHHVSPVQTNSTAPSTNVHGIDAIDGCRDPLEWTLAASADAGTTQTAGLRPSWKGRDVKVQTDADAPHRSTHILLLVSGWHRPSAVGTPGGSRRRLPCPRGRAGIPRLSRVSMLSCPLESPSRGNKGSHYSHRSPAATAAPRPRIWPCCCCDADTGKLRSRNGWPDESLALDLDGTSRLAVLDGTSRSRPAQTAT